MNPHEMKKLTAFDPKQYENESDQSSDLFRLITDWRFKVPIAVIQLIKKIPIRYIMNYSEYDTINERYKSNYSNVMDNMTIFHRIFSKKYHILTKSDDDVILGEAPKIGFYIVKKRHHIVMCFVTITKFQNRASEYSSSNIRKFEYYVIAKDPEKVLQKYATKTSTSSAKVSFCNGKKNHTLPVFSATNNGATLSVPFKDFNKIILCNNEKFWIEEHINRFINGKSIYQKNQIKYKMGILLYGNPGTGKTSLIYAISDCMDLPILKINQKDILNFINNKDNYAYNGPKGNIITSFSENGGAWSYRFTNVEHPEKSWSRTRPVIYLIEELDSLCNESESVINKRTFDDMETTNQLKLQRSQILQFIDSLPGNVILFATTNHIDKIDEALIRPGRFDIKLKLGMFDRESTKQLIATYPNIDPSFIDRYKEEDFPICPAQVEFDIVSEICKNMTTI